MSARKSQPSAIMDRNAIRLLLAAIPALLVLAVQATGVAQTAPSDPHRARPPLSVRLYVMDCGTLHIADMGRFQLKKDEVATTDLSVACFLVVHPKGTLIWDTGAVPDDSWKPTGSLVTQHIVLPDAQQRDLTMVKPLKTQLAELGFSPSAITYLALSHYHYDHTANANEFSGATWLVRQAERDAMFADKPPGTTQPSTYAALRNSKTLLLKNDPYDVFGRHHIGSWAHTGPPGALLEAGQDRRGFAVGRSLSLPGRTVPGSCAHLRVQSGADTHDESRGRRILEEDARAALDTARLQRQCQAEEVAQLLRVGPLPGFVRPQHLPTRSLARLKG
jgi:glyoxylase-like metal-dependent hydrolase (beta-lactamase superfamily II)